MNETLQNGPSLNLRKIGERRLVLSPDQRATFRRRVIDFNLPALDNSQAVLSPLSAERHQSSDHVSQFYFSRVNPTFSVT